MTLRKVASGKLFVTVVEAADLIASSADGKSDPFCVIRVGDNQESATPVIKNELNPKWNYTVSTCTLVIQCTFTSISVLIGCICTTQCNWKFKWFINVIISEIIF